MSTAVEGALLRIMASVGRGNDEKAPASMDDAMLVTRSVMRYAEFRERARMLSHLVGDAIIEARQETCRALVILMLKSAPEADPGPKTEFITATSSYAMLCVPTPGSKWAAHVDATYKKTGAADVANVSPYLGVLIAALEDLFNVQGHLLKTRPDSAQISRISWHQPVDNTAA